MIYLDVGHGQDNRRRGVYDPGAVHVGVTEADMVRDVAAEALARLRAAGVPGEIAPDGLLGLRVKWQRRTLTEDDVLVSLHMNAGGGTGTEVLYAIGRPELQAPASRLSALMASGLHLRDRGAKPDTESHGGKVAILRASPFAWAFLAELGFIDTAADRLAVASSGGAVVAESLMRAFR